MGRGGQWDKAPGATISGARLQRGRHPGEGHERKAPRVKLSWLGATVGGIIWGCSEDSLVPESGLARGWQNLWG
jgi:hypothetical protein